MQRRTRAPSSAEGGVDRDQSENRNKKNRSSAGSASNEAGFDAPVGVLVPSAPSPQSSGGDDATSAGGAHGQQSFLSSIFSHLAEARKELEALAAAKHASGSSAAGGGGGGVGQAGVGDESDKRKEQAVRVRLERCLALVKGVIRGAPGVMTPAHSNRGMGLPWEVTVIIKSPVVKHLAAAGGGAGGLYGGASASISGTVVSTHSSLAGGAGATPGGGTTASSSWARPPEKYVLEVHPLETMGSLRVRVAATNGLGQAADYTRLLSGGKTLNMDGHTVSEAGIGDGANMLTITSNTPILSGLSGAQAERSRLDAAARQEGGTMHDGDVIAKQSGPFDELFRLLECAHGLEVRKEIHILFHDRSPSLNVFAAFVRRRFVFPFAADYCRPVVENGYSEVA